MKNCNRPKNAETDLIKVKNYMLGVDFVSAENVCVAIGFDLISKLASVKSRLRDLPLAKYGGYIKQTKWVNGIMQYKISINNNNQLSLF